MEGKFAEDHADGVTSPDYEVPYAFEGSITATPYDEALVVLGFQLVEDLRGKIVVELASGAGSFIRGLLNADIRAYGIDPFYSMGLYNMQKRFALSEDLLRGKMDPEYRDVAIASLHTHYAMLLDSLSLYYDNYKVGTFSEIPLSDDVADYTVCIFGLEIIEGLTEIRGWEEEYYYTAFEEMLRVTKTGGQIIFAPCYSFEIEEETLLLRALKQLIQEKKISFVLEPVNIVTHTGVPVESRLRITKLSE